MRFAIHGFVGSLQTWVGSSPFEASCWGPSPTFSQVNGGRVVQHSHTSTWVGLLVQQGLATVRRNQLTPNSSDQRTQRASQLPRLSQRVRGPRYDRLRVRQGKVDALR
jgi:hypothetical protein